jgi:hypothetical protein
MDGEGDVLFRELSAAWGLAERMIEAASREELVESARVLALQAAAYARRFGELPWTTSAHSKRGIGTHCGRGPRIRRTADSEVGTAKRFGGSQG